MTSPYSVSPPWDVDTGVDADSGLYQEPPDSWQERHVDDDDGGDE